LNSVPNKHPDYFFWSGYSKVQAATSLWRKRLAKLFEKANVPNAHSHRFRDTFATTLLESGVSLENVSKLLAHDSIRVTEKHYAP
jgi:integrase/recombinase XerD